MKQFSLLFIIESCVQQGVRSTLYCTEGVVKMWKEKSYMSLS